MRSLFAAVALIGCFALTTPAFSQGGPVVKRGYMAGAVSPDLSSPEAGTVTQKVQRYKVPNPQKDFLVAWTEYTIPDCTPHGPGTWIFTPKANYGEVTQGQITGTLGNGDCPGKQFTFAAIYYKWTAHNNHSVEVNKAGPTDRFNASWKPPTLSNEDYVFKINVPVVRPAGEYSHFTNWDTAPPYLGATAVFHMTLKCCSPAGANGAASDGGGDNDKTFDFSGERLEEELTTNTYNKAVCNAGKPAVGHTVVNAGNRWGVDHVGWNACVGVAQIRCFKIGPCTATFTQEMRIQSPADSGYTKYSTNTQGSTVDAGTVDPAPNANKVTRGTVSAYRGGAVAPPNPVTTNLAMCPILATAPCQP